MVYHHRRIHTIAFLSLGIINVFVYLLVFAASITKAINGKLGEIIQAVYCCIFLVFNELKAFSLSNIYFGFLNVHHGKGLLILFLGCLVICENAFNIIVTIFGFTLGLGYVILSFIPCASLPKDICYCFHQYRNQKNDKYYNYHHKNYQHNSLVMYNTQPLGRFNMMAVNGYRYTLEQKNYDSHLLCLDNNSQSALFTLKSPIYPTIENHMNNFHY